MIADFPTLPETLFDYWTRADLLTCWWPEAAEVGNGLYHLAWPRLERTLLGQVTVFEPGQTFGFTWKWDFEPQLPERSVLLRFESVEVGTQITLEHGPYDDSVADQEDRQSHVEGWSFFLPKLQMHLEGLAATHRGG